MSGCGCVCSCVRACLCVCTFVRVYVCMCRHVHSTCVRCVCLRVYAGLAPMLGSVYALLGCETALCAYVTPGSNQPPMTHSTRPATTTKSPHRRTHALTLAPTLRLAHTLSLIDTHARTPSPTHPPTHSPDCKTPHPFPAFLSSFSATTARVRSCCSGTSRRSRRARETMSSRRFVWRGRLRVCACGHTRWYLSACVHALSVSRVH